MQATRLKVLKEKEVDDALGPLREKFTADLRAHAEAIDALMLAAEQEAGRGADPRRPLRRIQAIAHRLAGVSAILGFPEVGALAQRSELTIARMIADSDDGPDGPAGAVALDAIGALLDDLVVEMDRRAGAGR